MPPALVLLACTCFVLFLLRFDLNQQPKVSRALWIPTIWMVICGSKPLSIWFGFGYDESGSALDRVVLSGLLLAGWFILVRRRLDWSSAFKDNVWLMLLLFYMLMSILWSETPGVSFKRWFRELGSIIMALLVLTERSPRQAVESLLRRTVYILIPFSLLLIKYFPNLGVAYGRWSGEQMWVGVTLQKNGLG